MNGERSLKIKCERQINGIGNAVQTGWRQNREAQMGNAEKMALSVSETATLLGVSRPTVYQLMHCEDFPAFKVGTRTLISRAGLETWVDTQAARNAQRVREVRA